MDTTGRTAPKKETKHGCIIEEVEIFNFALSSKRAGRQFIRRTKS